VLGCRVLGCRVLGWRETVRIGILGGGNISDTHARAARGIAGVEIAAVYGQNSSKVTRLAAEYGGRAYSDLHRFLDHRPMDLVAIGSPSGLHAEHGIAAARRGLHVIVEKPLDISTARADALVEATDGAGVKLGVFFQDRLKPDVVRMKRLVDAGALGRPILASGRVKWYRPPEYYSGSRWRGTQALDGGGAVINQAIHTLDLLLMLFGPIARVDAKVATRLHDIEVEDTAVAALEFESGALGVFEASTAAFPGYARRVELTGTTGTLILQHDTLIEHRLGSDLDFCLGNRGENQDLTPTNTTSPAVSDASAHQRVLEDFLRAIATNSQPACDGREGRRSVALVEAIYTSARLGSSTAIVG
jgi:UDP-N-acetyl-2-amino-2-deoxyglucuronate dehydrogenase